MFKQSKNFLWHFMAQKMESNKNIKEETFDELLSFVGKPKSLYGETKTSPNI